MRGSDPPVETVQLTSAQFRAGHGVFLDRMRQASGIPFTGCEHPTFLDEEIQYKYAVLDRGRRALQLGKWNSWKPGDGKILAALQQACRPEISKNLLPHRYGGAAPLTKAQRPEDVALMEAETRLFLCGNELIGVRFDRFANYLRDEHLGCSWTFVSYLAFLGEQGRVFTVSPKKLDALLRFYGVDATVSKRVEWARYEVLHSLADALRSHLAMYGWADSIQAQSYMWVVASALEKNVSAVGVDPQGNAAEELERRLAKARMREENGLRGELLVLELERTTLIEAGRHELAARVRHVAMDGTGCGYDVRSFYIDGRERHLEVKTTTDDQSSDRGFWLSENERAVAEEDPAWELVRVWGMGSTATAESLGNVVVEMPDGWQLSADSWFVGPES